MRSTRGILSERIRVHEHRVPESVLIVSRQLVLFPSGVGACDPQSATRLAPAPPGPAFRECPRPRSIRAQLGAESRASDSYQKATRHYSPLLVAQSVRLDQPCPKRWRGVDWQWQEQTLVRMP